MRAFITFEGGEGSGKSSVVKLVKSHLDSMGVESVLTREPGGSLVAERIRGVLFHPDGTVIDDRTEALLFVAARRQHWVEVIHPALLQGKVVLCDRFIDSSLVYQGYVKGLGVDAILHLNSFALDSLFPDVTFWLDVTPEIGLQRIQVNQSREVNRLDKESMEFHHKVREGYQKLQQRFPHRIVRIDADKPLSEVFAEVMHQLKQRGFQV